MPSPVISNLFRYPGSKPITRIQTKSGSTGAGTASSVTVTLTNNAVVGNTLLVGFDSAATIFGVKFGSNSLAYVGAIHLAIVPVIEVSKTVVITLNGTTRGAAIVTEYSGTLITPDVPLLESTGSSTTNTTGTLAATRYSNELIIAIMARQGATSTDQTAWLTSPTNSFASVLQTSSTSNNAADRWVAMLERFVTATGTYSTAGTQANVAWQNGIASFVGG